MFTLNEICHQKSISIFQRQKSKIRWFLYSSCFVRFRFPFVLFSSSGLSFFSTYFLSLSIFFLLSSLSFNDIFHSNVIELNFSFSELNGKMTTCARCNRNDFIKCNNNFTFLTKTFQSLKKVFFFHFFSKTKFNIRNCLGFMASINKRNNDWWFGYNTKVVVWYDSKNAEIEKREDWFIVCPVLLLQSSDEKKSVPFTLICFQQTNTLSRSIFFQFRKSSFKDIPSYPIYPILFFPFLFALDSIPFCETKLNSKFLRLKAWPEISAGDKSVTSKFQEFKLDPFLFLFVFLS